MINSSFAKFVALFWVVGLFFITISAQQTVSLQNKSQELSEIDGIPVLLKHLPDWENVRNGAGFVTNSEDLKKVLGERQVFDLIDFSGGTEAVTASYPQGRLLIVEYSTPQASVDTDNKVKQRLTESQENPPVFYRRIGNYNVFLFDGTDETEANSLFDQIKYEKVVQWLGENPTLLRKAERAIVKGTSDLILSTATVIVLGLVFALLTGIIAGIIFYFIREQKRSTMTAFSDAGGMTRLNLDGLTPDISANRLLGE
ncbi:MAG: hypothetical protein ABIP06_02060 [Pyrinomonadaceae bacterium]